MANAVVLCDSNVIIEILRGNSKTKNTLEKIGFENLSLSIITHAEILYGTPKSDYKKISQFLKSFKTYSIDSGVSKIFLEIINSYVISHKIKIPDAFIAATAISNSISLYTHNTKDFKFIQDLKLYKPK